MEKRLENLEKTIQTYHVQEHQWHQQLYQLEDRIAKKIDARFVPYYHPTIPPSGEHAPIFNVYGEPMEICFMLDSNIAHAPNAGGNRYIYWDRYNYGLPLHFYTHEFVFQPVGKPKKKFAMFVESRSIVPHTYEMALANKDYMEQEFEYVFTYDAQMLASFSNARFIPFCASLWYGRTSDGGGLSVEQHKHKTKNVSMIASNKSMCEMHIVRKDLAMKLKNQGLADTFGEFDGGPRIPVVDVALEKYRYAVVVENDIVPFYYTEKIINCFASQTVPIYLGATEIGRFYRSDGIIQLKREDIDHIEDILAKCTPEDYEHRLPAILENYKRALFYATHTAQDIMYTKYVAEQ